MTVLKAGDVAVILGCATGIGRAAARKWASQGVKLALFDNSPVLEKTSSELTSKTEVLHVIGDITAEKEVASFKDAVFKKFGKVDLLFLNAGIGHNSNFSSVEPIRQLLEVNFFGYVTGVSSFYDAIKAQGTPSRIILTGSKQGITNPPGNPGYNASKAAVKIYAEGLSYDAKDSEVKVSLLVPGWAHTNLTGDKEGIPAPKPAGAWTPEQVVDYMEELMAKDSFYIICPDNEVSSALDKKRFEWSAGDMVHDRPALSRWRKEYTAEFAEKIKDIK